MSDRYAMFLSADYFVPHWKSIAGEPLSEAGVRAVQSAAREAVRGFMAGGQVYWDVDFSEARAKRSLAQYLARIETLDRYDREVEEAMRSAFCDSGQEQTNVQFALNFLGRIATDRAFRVEARIRSEDADAVADALTRSRQDLLDEEQLELDWLSADSVWDTRIRELTPDLPAYTASSFKNVYRMVKALPEFLSRLMDITGSEGYRETLRRLNDRMTAQFPRGSSLDVPSLMLVGG